MIALFARESSVRHVLASFNHLSTLPPLHGYLKVIIRTIRVSAIERSSAVTIIPSTGKSVRSCQRSSRKKDSKDVGFRLDAYPYRLILQSGTWWPPGAVGVVNHCQMGVL